MIEVKTGEIDTQRSGFLPIRVSNLEDLQRIAKEYNGILLHDMAGKTEAQHEFVVVIGNVIYFTEKPKEK